MTYNSLKEVQGVWGPVLKFFEAPQPPEKVIRKDPKISAMAESVLSGKPMDEVMRSQGTVLVDKRNNVVSSAVIPKANDARYLHALEVVKRYEIALQYANAKAKRELGIKIAALNELISEVFGE